jgi:(2Fe-2S) ferredoxin
LPIDRRWLLNSALSTLRLPEVLGIALTLTSDDASRFRLATCDNLPELSRMTAFTHHIFVCGNRRAPGHRRGCCDPDGQDRLRSELKALVSERGLTPAVRVNKAGCLEQCEHGPTLVIYPQGIWYGGVTTADLPRIVSETIEQGTILEDLLIRDECLNNPACEHIVARNSAPAPHPAD